MKTKVLSLSLFRNCTFLLLFIFAGCKKEDSGTPTDQNSSPWGSTVSLTISGKVVNDVTGTPIAGALVKAGSVSATTDNNGIFILKDAPGKSSLAFVQVEKAGYFSGSRSFLPTSGGGNVRIRLMPKIETGTISAPLGGEVSTATGGKVMLEPSSVTKNGAPYTGSVKVFLQTIDPTVEDFESRMPGNLIAMEGSQARGLKSFGMLAAELTDDAGAALQIASGKKAHITFPIPATLQSTAADSIDLWYFDDTNGYWKKEGRAGKEGNFYHAAVSHFSFWNCDVPYNFIELKGRILTNGQPLADARVTISSPGMGIRSDFTNAEGRFGGFVPKNDILSLKVEVLCQGTFTEVYSQNIGPFASNSTLNDINVTVPNTIHITGTITGCNNASVSNAYVMVHGLAYFPDATGNLSFSICGPNPTLIAFGGNPWMQGSSQIINPAGGNATVNLQVCGGAAGGTVTDVDGNVYNTVTIGTQVWMKENLKVSRYRNGDPIPANLDSVAWKQTTNGACAVYNDNPEYNPIYGKLYNWYAVADSRNLCPAGWHVPTGAEWESLISNLGGDNIAGGKMKSVGNTLDGSGFWESPNTAATNESGFTGLPGGLAGSHGSYFSLGHYGCWWSSTGLSSFEAVGIRLYYNQGSSDRQQSGILNYGYSVRCLKD